MANQPLRNVAAAVLLLAGCSGPAEQPPDDGGAGGDGGAGACNIDEVLARPTNGCTTASCHGGYAAGINLTDPDHLKTLLTGRAKSAACNGRRYVDPANPTQSLLLEILDPARYHTGQTCVAPMPLGLPPMSADDLKCVEKFVLDEVAAGHAVVAGYKDEFAPSDPLSYARKVKTITTGGALTKEEYDAIAADPKVFPARVQGWLASPEGQDRLARFLSLELQQHMPGGLPSVQDAVRMGGGGTAMRDPRIAANLSESFVRTAKAAFARGAPLTDLFTTDEWQVTTALLAYLSAFDALAAGRAESFRLFVNPPSFYKDPKNERTVNNVLSIVSVFDGVEYIDKAAPIRASLAGLDDTILATPAARALNRSWRLSDVMAAPVSPIVGAAVADQDGDPNDRKERCYFGPLSREGYIPLDMRGMIELMFGRILCKQSAALGFEARNLMLRDTDYTDWRPVRFVAESGGAKAVPFYDVDRLRAAAGQVALHRPIRGFHTTPAFLTTWPTNDDNQFRVTTNQALISALGSRMSQGDPTPSPMVPMGVIDPAHVKEPACLDCHRLLDPMRAHFSYSMNTDYFPWEAGVGAHVDGVFAFQGFTQTPKQGTTGADAFGAALANHPDVAKAWVGKLCRYANSQQCSEADPEFLRLTKLFQDKRYDLVALAGALFTSPLVTAAAYTDDYDARPVLVSITRQNHLCAELASRLGIADVCQRASVIGLLASLPDDTVARGDAHTQGAAFTSPLHQKTSIRFCEAIAKIAVGAGMTAVYKPSQPDAAITRMVNELMSLPDSAARATTWKSELRKHFDAVCQMNGGGANCSGASAIEALQSVFVLACTSPEVMGVGL